MSYFAAKVIALPLLEKHPNADSLSIVRLKDPFDVTLVVNTNEWTGRDKAVYVPFDAVLPPKPEYAWIGKDFRVRAKRLRGVLSVGILLPAQSEWSVGADVTQELGVVKYEPPPHRQHAGQEIKGPDFSVRYTDIESLRKHTDILVIGEDVVVQEKVDGSSGRFIYQDGNFYVGSHRRWVAEGDNLWWIVAKKYCLLDTLKLYPNHIFFGEVFGWVAPMRYGTRPGEYNLRFFDVFNCMCRVYLDYNDLDDILDSSFGNIIPAPTIYTGPWPGYEEAKKFSLGPSELGSESYKEGFVVRPVKERYNDTIGRVILKYHSDEWLIHH